MDIEIIIERAQEIAQEMARNEPNMPEGYVRAVDMFDQVRTHSDSGHFPERLFAQKAPNETVEEFNYRKAIYRSATYYAWARAVGALSRVMNDQNYSVEVPESSAALAGRNEDIGKYLFYNYPSHESVMDYFKTVTFPESLADPNAVAVVMPKEWDMIFDDSAFIDSVINIYECWRVPLFEEGEYALIMLGNEEQLRSNKTTKPLRKYLWVDAEKYVYLVEVKGKDNKRKVAVDEWNGEAAIFYHDLSAFPARKLKGKPTKVGKDIVYESYLYPAVPTLDRATCDQSTLDISKYNHAFLQRWEYVTECDAVGCHSGFVNDVDSHGETVGQRKCGSCKGTGTKRMVGPMQAFTIQIPEREGDAKPQLPPAGYIDLDHTILNFLDEQVERNINKAFIMLNIDISGTDVKGSDTALGKQIDREELFSFLQSISTTTFNFIEWALNMLMLMRYGNLQDEGIKVSRPQAFDIRNSTQLLQEVKDSELSVRKWLVREYAAQRFGSTSRQVEVTELAIAVDDFYGMTPLEIQGIVTAQIQPRWKAVLHYEFTSILDDLVEQMPDFMLQPLSEIKRMMREEAEARTQAAPNNDFRIEQIIGAANAR